MKTFSYSDITRRSGDVLDAALVEPVALEKHGKRKLVIMSAETYESRFPAGPVAYGVADAPAAVVDDLERGVAEILDEA